MKLTPKQEQVLQFLVNQNKWTETGNRRVPIATVRVLVRYGLAQFHPTWRAMVARSTKKGLRRVRPTYRERREFDALVAEWQAILDAEGGGDLLRLEWARKHFHRRHEQSSFGQYLRSRVPIGIWEQLCLEQFQAAYKRALNDDCERCGEKTRQVVTTPLGEIVQDWNAESDRSVAEIDEDICDQCGEDVIAACEEYDDAP